MTTWAGFKLSLGTRGPNLGKGFQFLVYIGEPPPPGGPKYPAILRGSLLQFHQMLFSFSFWNPEYLQLSSTFTLQNRLIVQFDPITRRYTYFCTLHLLLVLKCQANTIPERDLSQGSNLLSIQSNRGSRWRIDRDNAGSATVEMAPADTHVTWAIYSVYCVMMQFKRRLLCSTSHLRESQSCCCKLGIMMRRFGCKIVGSQLKLQRA